MIKVTEHEFHLLCHLRGEEGRVNKTMREQSAVIFMHFPLS